MEWQHGNYTLTDDPDLINLDYTFKKLSQTYWAKTRPRRVFEKSLPNSLCFVLLHQDTQVGFARVITDRAVMGYLADVFIDETHRGKGLGKWLISRIITHPDLLTCKIILETADAHGLYEQYGFKHIEAMKRWPT
jgi:GNAT superfamily N-acetyltransferase